MPAARKPCRPRAPWRAIAAFGVRFVFFWLCAVAASPAQIAVRDDTGATVVLARPARRIVSLAPHTTEMLYAAGAGERLVGAGEYSDYPEAAKKIPHVGGSAGFDLEAILALRPDLVVGWKSGNPPRQVERLRELGIAVYLSEPRRVTDIAASIERLGELAGTQAAAAKAGAELRQRLETLRLRHAGRPRVRVFYQILDSTPITVNGRHMISDIIRLCGGENVFAELPVLAPRVDMEAVLAADPEAIVAGGMASAWEEWRRRWREWPGLRAARAQNLFFIPSDLIHRGGPRILQGAERMCLALEQARAHR